MQIPPGFIAVFAQYTNADGHNCQNSVGYDILAGFDQDDADAISASITIPYRAQLDSGSRYDLTHVLVGQDGGDPLVFDSTDNVGAGSGGAALCPPNVQGLITKTTGVSGRHNRGRMFIADMRASEVNSQGGMGATPVARLQAIANAWNSLPSVVATLGDPHILHNDSTPPTVITAMTAQATVATQRRRLER